MTNAAVSRLTLATAVLLAGVSQPALAQDATAFADRLVATGKLMGISFSYGSATGGGDTITVSDFTIAVPGEDDAEVPGDIVFTGVVETPEGGYTAERATLADIEHTDDEQELTVSLVDIVVEGIALPAEATLDTAVDASLTLYDRIAAGPLVVREIDGAELFSIETMEVTMDEPAQDGGVASAYQVSGIHIDLSTIEEPEAREMIAAYDLEQINASMSGAGTWWPDTGRVQIEDSSIVLENLGALSLAMELEGYTRALYQEVIAMNVEVAELAEAGEEIDEERMDEFNDAMAQTFQDVALASASLRYEDDSLFSKALDFAGQMQGVDGETLRLGLPFMAAMALAEVENAELRAMATEAINTFTADPQNITISVAPDEPVAFSELESIDYEADPYALVDLLKLNISAND